MKASEFDYEEYARKRPCIHSSLKYPGLYQRAIAGLSGTYVDVGAGDGMMLKHSLQSGYLSGFTKIIACDISSERVARIKENLPSVEALVANAESVPLPDASVDFYYSDQVIEHVDDDQRMAHDIRRLLKPGGKALVGSTFKEKGAWYFYRCNGRWVNDPTHIREYESMDDFKALFTRAGLKIIDTSLEPLSYNVGDLAIRALALSGLRKFDSRKKSNLIKWLSHQKVRIPRYFLNYAFVERAD